MSFFVEENVTFCQRSIVWFGGGEGGATKVQAPHFILGNNATVVYEGNNNSVNCSILCERAKPTKNPVDVSFHRELHVKILNSEAIL